MPPKRRPPDPSPPGEISQRTPSTRFVRSRVSPASLSPAAIHSLRHIPPDSLEWADPQRTCLSLGLNPIDSTHAGVICDKCKFFWDKKLRSNISNLANVERTGRRLICEHPFDRSDVETNSRYNYKLRTRDKLKRLFASPDVVVSPATETVTPSIKGSSGRVDKSTNNRGPLKLFNDDGLFPLSQPTK